MRKVHFCCLMAFGLLFGFVVGASPATDGVVVEEVGEGSALEKAGLEPDDVLLRWERLPNPPTNPEVAQGEFHSPFHWEWVMIEQVPRGTVVLRGERRGEARDWTVEPGLWKGEVWPRMSVMQLEEYLRGRELMTAGDIEGGAVVWRGLAERDGNELLRCWVYLQLGDAWFEAQGWEEAHTAYQGALEVAHEPVTQVAVWDAAMKLYLRRNDFDQAEASIRSALEVYRMTWGEGLGFANGLNNMGRVHGMRGKIGVAAAHYQQALTIQQALAPASLTTAGILNNLGIVATKQGQFKVAAEHYQQALEIVDKLAPGTLFTARIFSNLGTVAYRRGQFDEAVEYHQQALQIYQKSESSDSLNVANVLTNLGLVFMDRGQLSKAEENHQQARVIQQKLSPGSLSMATSLLNLGIVSIKQGRLDEAEKYFQKSLEIEKKLSPGSLEIANSLHQLGVVAYERGQLDTAVVYYQQALEIRQRLKHDHPNTASSLLNLGDIAYERGQLDAAAKHYQQALEILRDFDGSILLADSLNNLGLVAKGRGQINFAEGYFDRSLDILENQIGKLGGSQWVKGSFRAQHQWLYRNYIDFLLQSSQYEKTFSITERFRAQSFLAMLEERDLVFSDLPEELGLQRQSLAARHDRAMRRLALLSPTRDQEQFQALQAELNALYQERDDLRAKIRRESPHLANLQYPQPLDHPATQKALDPGTVVLSYSVGKTQTDLFVVTPDRPLTVHTINLDENALQEKVEGFRRMVEESKGTGTLGTLRKKSAISTGKHLYDLLIAPAQATIDANDRILLIPDGPLHLLPFAALIQATDESGDDWRYLIEDKPLHTVLSATVYAEIKETRPAPTSNGADGPLLAAFGDPYYSPSEQADHGTRDVHVRSARERCKFTTAYRLPASRREALEISNLYRNVRTHLGEGASEESLKTLDQDTKILHIAAHACLDDHLPLNSGLLLTLPEGFPEDRDDGLLQAWEIFENVRLDADLVVLSACGSGLGEDQGGEGLIGLTRAFQYAGARTVAATLWQVDDLVTAELMVRFYRHLRAGETKDAALRAAQLELIRSPVEVRGEDGQSVRLDASSPYFWAAFQLHGDWQ